MNLSDLAQPTTVIGLAGLAIFAVVYVILQFDKSHKREMEESRKERQTIMDDYKNFVNERNHQTGEIIVKSTEVMVEVKESIKQNTESVKQLIDIHLRK